MYKDVLRTIAGIANLPVVSFLLFFAFFALATLYALRMKKKTVAEAAAVPFNDGAKIPLLLALLLLIPAATHAQTPATQTPPVTTTQVIWALLITMIALALAILVNVILVYIMVRERLNAAAPTAAPAPTWTFATAWAAVIRRMTDAVPLAREADIDLGHNYDGIRELDNNLPPWWVYGFYATIIFSAAYLWFFHLSDAGYGQAEEYNREIAQAQLAKDEYLKKAANLIDENNVTRLTDPARIAAGKATYIANCKVCHGENGEGGVGPNLTDPYWLHGGSIASIFKVIKYGITEKGMVAWQASLRPAQMQEVASFVMTLQGTNPPNPKEKQGDPYTPPADSAAAPTTTPPQQASLLTPSGRFLAAH